MKPIISFLNNVKREREGNTTKEEWFLEKKIEESSYQSIQEIDSSVKKFTEKTFKSPTAPPKPKDSEFITISYKKPKKQVERVKNLLETTNNKEIGEKTFDYFFEREIDE